MQRRRPLALRLALFAIAAALLWESLGVARSMAGRGTDFVEYWSASRLLLSGHNPYDPAQMDAVQRSLGFERAEPLLMLNPPWSLPFVLPLGLLSYAAAQQLWLAMNLIALAGSVWIGYRIYFAGAMPAGLAYALGLSFVPALTCVALGQISVLLLLGLMAFLGLQSRRLDWEAGASLLLAALKPHAVWLLWPALLWWCVGERRWRILLGFGFALSCAGAAAVLLDGNAFRDYLDVLHSYGVLRREVPTAAGWLIHAFAPQQRWLEAAPLAAGLIWLGWTGLRSRAGWRWPERLPGIVLVSLATSIYGWYFDQVALLPALLCAAAGLQNSGAPILARRAVLLAYLVINVAPAVLLLQGFRVFAYAWTTPAWLALYLAAQAVGRMPRLAGASSAA